LLCSFRSTQARLFNEDNTGYDVLVASDAIGMGLNLNIRRIIFHTVVKQGGVVDGGPSFVDPSSVKQIAGRAGRLSSNVTIYINLSMYLYLCINLYYFDV
jgi:ATP-dependent RNA helicase SUPV3L1/SUV3